MPGPDFSRRVAAFVLMALAVTAALALARWQYGAWESERASEARDLSRQPAVALTRVIGPDQAFPGDQVGRPVTVSGAWLASGSFAVSDRPRQGRQGYWIVTPMSVEDTDSAVLVVRGWSPTPRVAPPSGGVTVRGFLQPGEGTGAPDSDPTDRVVPELRIASVTQFVDRDLFAGFVVARAARPSTGLPAVARGQVPQVAVSTGLRNLLYAVQWVIFAGFAVVVWWRSLRDPAPGRPDGEDPGGSGPPEGPDEPPPGAAAKPDERPVTDARVGADGGVGSHA